MLLHQRMLLLLLLLLLVLVLVPVLYFSHCVTATVCTVAAVPEAQSNKRLERHPKRKCIDSFATVYGVASQSAIHPCMVHGKCADFCVRCERFSLFQPSRMLFSHSGWFFIALCGSSTLFSCVIRGHLFSNSLFHSLCLSLSCARASLHRAATMVNHVISHYISRSLLIVLSSQTMHTLCKSKCITY